MGVEYCQPEVFFSDHSEIPQGRGSPSNPKSVPGQRNGQALWTQTLIDT